MGVSLFLVWREGLNRYEVKLAIYVFAAQFAVNILWSAAFFGMRSPIAGLVVIIVLWIMILLTVVKFWPVSRNAALLLVPYIIWVSFAAYLNYSLLMLNP
jgi:tryptophan-rich sensory protein